MSSPFQFSYSNSRIPSLPMVDVEVIGISGKSNPNKKGKIDTGADGTSIPEELVQTLELEETGKIWVKDVNGGRVRRSTYDVFIKIGTMEFDLMRVSATPRDNVLIGRNLINLWNLKLDGQTRTGELIPWSTNPDDAK